MYYMEHLLILLTAEDAGSLRFCAGSPPVIVSEGEHRPLQGPAVSDEEVLLLLRKLASSRQMRELRECGKVQFMYSSPGHPPFLVRAKMFEEQIIFDVS
ncbi:MAG TPA: hypothetical protein VK815_03645 [Candidatus Acidoferrales bacterium]|jgi:Tfp pilus assembly pilus retraction ATPase PilT|nr:hypothetical protein [Candidatus Acidoferrales bacterium]